MQRHRLILPLTLGGLALAALSPSRAIAAPQWQKVTENLVGDRFLVDISAIQEQGSNRFYWEYREFVQPNNAFLEVKVSQPVEGAVVRWSINCGTKAQRLLKVNAYTTNRQLIQKFTYGDSGVAVSSRPGSSTYKVGEFVCNAKL
ncbi:MAG: hypothetical protein RLZZ511_933 [Cyanobacteriota bacterium]|jgi:hypothetical protein